MAGHLIHVGYAKAGSTFLQRWFALHPALAYAPGAIGGFRDVYEICHAPETREAYRVTSTEALSFPYRGAGAHGVLRSADEYTPPDRIKEAQAAVCAALRDLFPGSRILIVTRGFRAMIASGYSQYVRTGGTKSLDAMCRSLADPAAGRNDYYDFDYLIGLYEAAFGAEAVIVLPFELLRDDPLRFLAEIETRLGLPHADTEIGRENPSLSPEALYWYPRFARLVAAAMTAFGPRAAAWAHRRYAALTLHDRLRPAVRLLARLRPGRRVTSADVPAHVLRCCVGQATRLRENPLYAPYAAEYLWNVDRPTPETTPRRAAAPARG